MRKNIYNILIVFILFILLITILLFSNDVVFNVMLAIKIWKENIFTSLFPFFIISDLLINYGFVELISIITNPIINKLFFLPGNCAFIIIISMLSGCPSNAKYIKEILESKKISNEQAQFLLSFTHFPNPLFILGFVGDNILNNKKIGIIILISIIIGNFIIGFFTKKESNYIFKKQNIKQVLNNISEKTKSNNFVATISNSIFKSINTLLLLLGIITIFYILTSIIFNIFNFTNIQKTLISGFLEMTQGIKNIKALEIPLLLKSIIITSFVSFGGISIHMQVMSVLSDNKIKYRYYLLSRICHMFISSFISFILFKIFIT